MQSYSLFELNEYIRRVLVLNFAEALWIRCEIGQLNESGGHIFMDLVQKNEETDEIIARAESVIWKKSLKQIINSSQLPLEQILQEGNEVLFKTQVDFHERYGLKLIVEEIDGDFTLGKILVRRTEILQRLKKRGLLYKNASLKLPHVIQKVAVISSANAAGLQDYLQQIQHNPLGYKIENTLFATTVQGDRAAQNITKQLESIKRKPDFDIVVIIRGGGARLDLSAFDEYDLGKAIAKCPLPVITGIGHDVDETVADQVAHTDLKTPTAVADFIIHHNSAFEFRMEQMGQGIKDISNGILQRHLLQLQSQQQRIQFFANRKYQGAVRELDVHTQRFSQHLQRYFLEQRSQLDQLEHRLAGYDAQQILDKGYALVTKDGKKVDSIELLKPSDHLNIILRDGEALVRVEQLKIE